METKTLTIAGMSCQHCVMHVKKELAPIGTVKEVQIGRAVIEIDPAAVTPETLRTAVTKAGYELVRVA